EHLWIGHLKIDQRLEEVRELASREQIRDVAHRSRDVEREDDAERLRMRRAVAALADANAERVHQGMDLGGSEDLLLRLIAALKGEGLVRVEAVVSVAHRSTPSRDLKLMVARRPVRFEGRPIELFFDGPRIVTR